MEYKLIFEENFDNARKEIKKIGKETSIIFSGDDETNRKVLEKEKIDILLLNQANRKDFQKQRNSGLNQVLAKLAKMNNVVIGTNLDEITQSKSKSKAEIISRIKQNIKICSKNKLKMKFIAINEKNQRNIYDLKALGIVLGMPTFMTKTL
jgi:ribonuclease P/MRP protein subunit RPP1